MKYIFLLLACAVCLLSVRLSGSAEQKSLVTEASVVKVPATAGQNRYYVSNKEPLAASPLIKLPIGAIEPKGWLLSQLQLMRNGFTGRLKELSKFLGSGSGWLTLKDKGWEEMPYWLKGFGDLGYILKDPALIAEARRWLDEALSSQQPDGYFGPADNKKNRDLWPNMLMLSCLQSFHEATEDKRVIPFMTKYFRYEIGLPPDALLPGSWQKLRGGDNLESVYWLYNRIGEKFLLDLARRLFERTSDWTSPILTADRDKKREASSFYHGVNITMGFRQPGVYYQQAKDKKYLEAVERNYRQVMDEYGQQPGGMFGADENIRPGYGDPRQGAETCSMVEFMYSNESLLKITGDTRYAERCEEIAFNSLPAAVTPDLRGLHYLTAPNLISCDSSGDHDFQNRGTLVSYDPWSYRCCQHNFAFGWPYFSEHLWLATQDNGLAAVLYAPSQVTAKVADGAEVRIAEDTWYPFGDFIDLTLGTDKPVEFPLYLRIPEWSKDARILLNGGDLKVQVQPSSYVVLKRVWSNGDQVRLELPQTIEVKTWTKLGNAVSVRRGPLWYSLKIGERWNRCGGTEAWPAFEILPTTSWNYGLALNPANPASTISLAAQKPPAYQPFTPEAAPLLLRAKARRIPLWKEEKRMAGELPASPVQTSEPLEDITLIPMGCARLRISSFPTVALKK
jgi:hypothetical protein